MLLQTCVQQVCTLCHKVKLGRGCARHNRSSTHKNAGQPLLCIGQCLAFIQPELKGGCGTSLLGAVFAGLKPRLSVLPSWHAAFLLEICASRAFSRSELTEALLHIFLKALL